MPWVDDYADAMRDVYRDHSDDLDIASLFAEADDEPHAMVALESQHRRTG